MTRLRIRTLAVSLEVEGDADLVAQVLGTFVRRGIAAQQAVDAVTEKVTPAPAPKPAKTAGGRRRHQP